MRCCCCSSLFSSRCCITISSRDIRAILLLLLPSISVPTLPLFELFLCSSHVVAASPTAADDDDDNYDDDDYVNEYNECCNRCHSVCWIPKSIVVVSTSSIDVSYSPLLTAS